MLSDGIERLWLRALFHKTSDVRVYVWMLAPDLKAQKECYTRTQYDVVQVSLHLKAALHGE